MSPALIAGLVLAGLFILILIGFINQVVEKNNLEKARAKAELSNRMRRCSDLSDSFPGQLITSALKLMLTQLELHAGERLMTLDKKNQDLASRVELLRNAAAMGEAIPVTNAPVKILTEAQAKAVRLLLEDLHAQVVWGNKQGQLDTAAAKRWVGEVRRMMVILHIEYFNNLGKQALQQGNAHKARLAFERGIQHVRKQPDKASFQAQLKQLEAHFAHASHLEQTQQKPRLEETSELTEGLKDLESEDDWKKNNIY